MSSETGPPIKKIKMDAQSSLMSQKIDYYINKLFETKNLVPVLSDEFVKPIPLIKVYVGHVKDPKCLSRVIMILNEKIPLKELHHLKRVRKKEVILCPTHFLNGMSSIQEYLEFHVQELKSDFEYFKEIDVPLFAPKVKGQYNNQLWSCNFHPNNYYEKLVSDNFFSEDELTYHRNFMKLAFETVRWHSDKDKLYTSVFQVNAAVIVDPVIDSVVAVSYCVNDHPVQHTAMLAIDNVAKTQNGGVWGTRSDGTSYLLSGIDEELLLYLREVFHSVKFGSRSYVNKRDVAIDMNESSSLDGPYLCTGYYVYMLKEPCLMCSMALVHARAKRIFFCFDNKYGALKSRTKLQAEKSLNHHFEVFTGFL